MRTSKTPRTLIHYRIISRMYLIQQAGLHLLLLTAGASSIVITNRCAAVLPGPCSWIALNDPDSSPSETYHYLCPRDLDIPTTCISVLPHAAIYIEYGTAPADPSPAIHVSTPISWCVDATKTAEVELFTPPPAPSPAPIPPPRDLGRKVAPTFQERAHVRIRPVTIIHDLFFGRITAFHTAATEHFRNPRRWPILRRVCQVFLIILFCLVALSWILCMIVIVVTGHKKAAPNTGESETLPMGSGVWVSEQRAGEVHLRKVYLRTRTEVYSKPVEVVSGRQGYVSDAEQYKTGAGRLQPHDVKAGMDQKRDLP